MMRCRNFIGFVVVFGVASASHAETRVVPTQYAAIQQAIDASSNGDIVSILPGNYAGPIDLRGKSITVRGSADAASTVVSGGESVVRCTSGESALTVIENLTITGGSGEIGAGIRVDGSSPTIRECRIVGNQASFNNPKGTGQVFGGGIYVRNGSPTITRCLVAANSITFNAFPSSLNAVRGAGVYLDSSSAVVSDCDISGNYISAGPTGFFCGAGAAVFGASNPTFRRCRFIGNSLSLSGNSAPAGCPGSGLGIYFASGSRASIERCEFRQHVNYGCGGSGTQVGSGIPVIKMQSNPSLIYISGTLFCANLAPNIDGVYIDLGTNTFAATCPTNCRSDLNGDGVVNGDDLGDLLSQWGTCSN
jgi:hypothetical protein